MNFALRRAARFRLSAFSLAVAAVIIALDQLTKQWAVNELADGREVHVLWTLQWNLSYNTGMAFSRGQGFGPFIAVLAFVVVVVLVVSVSHVEGRLARVSAGLLIGGAVGNLADRLFRDDGWLRGAVVDFIDFQWWPIFNIADIGVSIGAVLFALSTMSQSRSAPSPPLVEPAETSDAT
jgi:signal peptidase II